MAETTLTTCGTGADGGQATGIGQFNPASWTNPNNISHGQDDTSYAEVILTPKEDI